MDNQTFESIISETLNDLNANDSQDSQEVEGTTNSDYQESTQNDVVEDTSNDVQDNSSEDSTSLEDNQESENEINNDDDDESNILDLEDDEDTPSMNEKDANAFARMRTELKQANSNLDAANSVIQFFDVRAKQMGLNGIQDLMEKTVEAEMTKQAKKEGIPVDVLKRISSLEDRIKQQDIERENMIKSQKEKDVNYVIDDFVQKHSLSQKSINKMANDLLADGFNFNTLMNMPRSAVNKILSSYLPKETVNQDILAKKEQIKKEVPPTGNSSSGPTLDDEIDKIAQKWVNRY